MKNSSKGKLYWKQKTIGRLMKLGLNFLAINISCGLILWIIGCSSLENQGHSKQIAHTHKTVIVYLVGLAGTGKYTIAKKMSRYGYKVVDNHLINNPIFSLADEHDSHQDVLSKISHIRNIVFGFIRGDNYANYVLTNELLEDEYGRDVYNKVLNTAAQRGSIFVPVKLVISKEERAKRIVQPERKDRFKLTDVNAVYEPNNLLHISHENLMELNVTNLSAEEAAKKIILHVKQIKSLK